MTTLTLTEKELRLLWMATETLREANYGDAEVEALDDKITEAVHAAAPNEASS